MSTSWQPVARAFVLPVLALALPVVLTGCVSRQTADRADAQVLGGLTRAEFNTAIRVARHAAKREGAEIRTASAGVVTGRRRSLLGVHGHACPPGRLLDVRLVGTFPHASPAPGSGSNAVVGGEDLIADPATGTVCAHSYLAGRIITDLSMVRLYSG
ncbi:hypothetical protein [Nocardioides cynanchi]|uniref:hypothetical protein n=1 Tax=Nocardioides cynanchi TaxID=2558918 RepID=UPI00124766D4|nr:hypothetical protein [Nocardioides cynanchi]